MEASIGKYGDKRKHVYRNVCNASKDVLKHQAENVHTSIQQLRVDFFPVCLSCQYNYIGHRQPTEDWYKNKGRCIVLILRPQKSDDPDFCGSEAITPRAKLLGESLYPQVEQLKRDAAAKVTGMLLEMDQTEVLHLLESPEALKSKVAEAMEVLRTVAAQQQANSPTDQLASPSLNDNLVS